MSPTFLDVDDVLKRHRLRVLEYGGSLADCRHSL